MAEKKTCDVFVLGAGPGGYVAAIRLAQLGKRVILAEKQWVGGVCLNVGCIPSKALIHAADFFHKMQNAGKMGLSTGQVSIDLNKVQEWKSSVISKLRHGVEFICKSTNVETIMGTGAFTSARTAKVISQAGEFEIEFQSAIIATGSTQIHLPQIEYDGLHIIDSSDALELREVPKRVAVVGGGYIGIEIGTFFAKVGAQVTILERGADILLMTDRDVVEVVKQRKKELGIATMLNTSIVSIDKSSVPLRIQVKDNSTGQESTLETDKIFIAVGRKPMTEGIGLETLKVEKDEKGFIKVGDRFETAEPNIFAIGDLIGNPTLAHKAFMEGRLCAEIIAGIRKDRKMSPIPSVIFSDPEIAMVGLTEQDAQKQNIPYRVSKFPFSALGRAFTMNNVYGFVKIIADQNSSKVLGIHIVGPEASNLIGESSLALALNANLEDIAGTIHPHPTLSEALGEAADLMLGRCVHFMQKKI